MVQRVRPDAWSGKHTIPWHLANLDMMRLHTLDDQVWGNDRRQFVLRSHQLEYTLPIWSNAQAYPHNQG